MSAAPIDSLSLALSQQPWFAIAPADLIQAVEGHVSDLKAEPLAN